jgi:hypothetical protein
MFIGLDAETIAKLEEEVFKESDTPSIHNAKESEISPLKSQASISMNFDQQRKESVVASSLKSPNLSSQQQPISKELRFHSLIHYSIVLL